MIQEAHVGIGIVGKEGRQAARCSDYAIAKFSMIKRMFLVHGHYFSDRLALMALYFFYKNFVFMAVQVSLSEVLLCAFKFVFPVCIPRCFNVLDTIRLRFVLPYIVQRGLYVSSGHGGGIE